MHRGGGERKVLMHSFVSYQHLSSRMIRPPTANPHDVVDIPSAEGLEAVFAQFRAEV